MTHRAVVMGGSLGGLNAAVWLAEAGWDVDVLERSRSPLEGRGAGIVLHPATVRYLSQCRGRALDEISAGAHRLVYLARDGSVVDTSPVHYRFAGWNTLYREMLACFKADRYHLGAEVTDFDQEAGKVTVQVAGRPAIDCDLLVAADGIGSTARHHVLPKVAPRYSGYVGWRGTAEEGQLSEATFRTIHEAINYYVMPNSHILTYPIPDVDGTVTPGERRLNWVWYRNVPEGEALDDLMTTRGGIRQAVGVPPGQVAQHHVDDLRSAARDLPPPLAEIVAKTGEPFIQAIFDLEVPRMVFGRVCLVGDAAFALRPHAAAGTAKAAEDAWQLSRAVGSGDDDLDDRLRQWESAQLALGRLATERTRDAGQRAQFDNTWKLGDPLPFGLYEVGDSFFRQAAS